MRVALLRVAVVGGAILALELACRLGLVAPAVIIPPSVMAVALVEILASGQIAADLLFTGRNVMVAVAVAAIGGVVAGAVLAGAPRLRRVSAPLLACWYAIPTFIFYPVLIVLFGAGAGAIIAIAALLAIVAMVSNTLLGLDRVPPVLGRTARVLRMGRLATAWRIQLPFAAPYLFTGLKLVVSYAFIGVIASEFILSGAGIGYDIANAYNNFDNRTMYALMLLVILAVTVVNASLHAIDQRLRARRGA